MAIFKFLSRISEQNLMHSNSVAQQPIEGPRPAVLCFPPSWPWAGCYAAYVLIRWSACHGTPSVNPKACFVLILLTRSRDERHESTFPSCRFWTLDLEPWTLAAWRFIYCATRLSFLKYTKNYTIHNFVLCKSPENRIGFNSCNCWEL